MGRVPELQEGGVEPLMKLKELKNFLLNYSANEARENDIRKEIGRIRERADTVRGVGSRSIAVIAGNPNLRDETYTQAAKVIETYDREIAALLDEISVIQRSRAKLTELLSMLDPEERDVIVTRYIKKTRWDFVPMKVHMSRATCFRVHDRAIMKMLERQGSE